MLALIIQIKTLRWLTISLLLLWGRSHVMAADRLLPAVEVEEHIYTFEPAHNGAGPMWGNASTCIVRLGEDVFASGLETIPDASPLNNVRWMLFKRAKTGWEVLLRDPKGRTREPCPLACLPDGRLFLSANPTLTDPSAASGPAAPQVLEFSTADPRAAANTLSPVWDGKPAFSEHSYRSFAADGLNRELVLFQNIGYTHAEWSFHDRSGKWSSQGRLQWPWGAGYEEPVPVRLCYPAVMLKDRAVYWCGVSDIVEPNKTWRAYKKELTGRNWDYDLRRLFFSFCPDIRSGKFRDWIEIASREKTGGWIFPCDIWVSPDGSVHILWAERALDERLRPKFFPEEKQTFALNYAVVRDGKVALRTPLALGGEGASSEIPGSGRFQVTPDNRLFVIYYCSGKDANGKAFAENRAMEVFPDGSHGDPVLVPLERPFTSFINATVRGGCAPAYILDMLGTTSLPGISYARVNLRSKILARFDIVTHRDATGSRVELDGSQCIATKGKVVAWRWDIGGVAASGTKVSRVFDRGGPLKITLTAMDEKGNRSETTRSVVLPPAPGDFGLKQWSAAVRTEAGSFVREGGGAIHVRNDKMGASGLSLSHWNTKGHWLEWEVDIPRQGDYFLLFHYATPENATRVLLIDDKAQALLNFPSTGGYGSDITDHWGFAKLTGAGVRPLATHRSRGRYRMRLENQDGAGLNLDYLDWIPAGNMELQDAAVPFRRVVDNGYPYLLPMRGILAPSRINAEIGHCYTVRLGPNYPGDGMPGIPPSNLRLFEDGKELGPAHLVHTEIRETGQGRFAHWKDFLYFSASDNSDPRTNGKRYEWVISEGAQ